MKISLCCIMGNEETVIARFLESFGPWVDALSITFAMGDKTPDGTYEIIRDYCREHKKEFRCSHYNNVVKGLAHVDHFGNARQLSWDKAPKADFLMWADADDLLQQGCGELLRKNLSESDHDVYVIPYHVRGASQVVMRERVVRNNGASHWKHAIHEQLGFARKASYISLPDVVIEHKPDAVKASSRDRNKTILNHELRDAGRNLFYLHEEENALGNHSVARDLGLAALRVPGLDVEMRYQTLLHLAQLPGTADESAEYAAEAFSIMPDRREALALLACHALAVKQPERALAFSRLMTSLATPPLYYWSMDRDWWGWRGWLLHLECLRKNQKHAEALIFEDEHFKPIISVVHPTFGRPYQARSVRDLYYSRARHPETIEYVFGIHEWDKESIEVLGGNHFGLSNRKGCAPNLYAAVAASSAPVLVGTQDDMEPCQDWDVKLLQSFPDLKQPWAVFVDDGSNHAPENQINYNCTRAFWDKVIGSDPWPGWGIYSDDEYTHRARRAGCVVEKYDILFKHNHPFFNPAVKWDATYAAENDKKNYEEGLALMCERNPDWIDNRRPA